MIERKCEFCSAVLEHPRFSICEECEKQWNEWAAWSDRHWADDPQVRSQDEITPWGESVYANTKRQALKGKYDDSSSSGS